MCLRAIRTPSIGARGSWSPLPERRSRVDARQRSFCGETHALHRTIGTRGPTMFVRAGSGGLPWCPARPGPRLASPRRMSPHVRRTQQHRACPGRGRGVRARRRHAGVSPWGHSVLMAFRYALPAWARLGIDRASRLSLATWRDVPWRVREFLDGVAPRSHGLLAARRRGRRRGGDRRASRTSLRLTCAPVRIASCIAL